MGEGTSRQGSRTTNATRSKTKQRASPANEEEECNTDVPASDPVAQRDQPKKKKPVPNSKQKVKSTPVSQSSISGFSFHRGNEDNMDVPVSDTVAPKGLPKKKKNRPAPTPRQKVESTPVSQTSISGFSFHNESGNMANVNVGNIYNSSITDAYNDNSVNVHGRWKPAWTPLCSPAIISRELGELDLASWTLRNLHYSLWCRRLRWMPTTYS